MSRETCFDTLRHDMRAFADRAGAHPGATHCKPVETARTSITMIGDHLRVA